VNSQDTPIAWDLVLMLTLLIGAIAALMIALA
jgi:hypothetical protein